MTVKETFTTDEWSALAQAPFCAALAVVAASPSGPIGAVKEMFAMGSAMQDTAGAGGDNPIVQAVIQELRSNPRAGQPAARPKSVEEAKQIGMDGCRRVAALLASKASPGDAQGFKRWLSAVSQKVAMAANEGGVFGIGGVKVSEAEQAALKDIEKVLGVAG
jgi:hypothetical protein